MLIDQQLAGFNFWFVPIWDLANLPSFPFKDRNLTTSFTSVTIGPEDGAVFLIFCCRWVLVNWLIGTYKLSYFVCAILRVFSELSIRVLAALTLSCFPGQEREKLFRRLDTQDKGFLSEAEIGPLNAALFETFPRLNNGKEPISASSSYMYDSSHSIRTVFVKFASLLHCIALFMYV